MKRGPHRMLRLTMVLYVCTHTLRVFITNEASAGQIVSSIADGLNAHSNGSSIASELLKQNNEHRLSIGDREFPLLFEDIDKQPIDRVIKEIVSEDFTLIYGHFTKYQLIDKPVTRLTVGDIEIDVTQHLHLEGRGRITPKSHKRRAQMISNVDGTQCLVIPKELTQEYQKAKTFREVHALAFSRLEELFRDFHSGRIRDSGHYTLSELVHLGTTHISRAIMEHAGRELLKVNVRWPSFVYVFVATEEEARLSGLPPGSIGARAVVLDKAGLPDGCISCVYYEGKWRFVMPSGM